MFPSDKFQVETPDTMLISLLNLKVRLFEVLSDLPISEKTLRVFYYLELMYS